MNVECLRDIVDMNLDCPETFIKCIELKESNIFPLFFTTTIERLLIKQYYSTAYEVFYGIIFYLPDAVYSSILTLYKAVLAEFTVSIQRQSLKAFRSLMKKPSFSSFLHAISPSYSKSSLIEILSSLKALFIHVRVNIEVSEEFPMPDKRSISFYTTLTVLNPKGRFYLLFKLSDYMDEEHLQDEENERNEKQLLEAKERKDQEDLRLKKIEEQRLYEEIRMKKEEKNQLKLMKKERNLTTKETNLMSFEETKSIKLLKKEKESQKKTEQDLIREEKLAIKFILEEEKQSKKNMKRMKEAEEFSVLSQAFYKAQDEEKYQKAEQLELLENEKKLLEEKKIIESLDLVCGSYFCIKCYRMLKRSSLFLKCSECCDRAFVKPLARTSNFSASFVPPNSKCVSCNEKIEKGEVIHCICCFIKHDFLKITKSCGACKDSGCVNWVDTYMGKQYEMIECGFCNRSVNYAYLVEVCSSCHDQICLHCLRKNLYIGISICGGCHNRHEVNPYKSVIKVQKVISSKLT